MNEEQVPALPTADDETAGEPDVAAPVVPEPPVAAEIADVPAVEELLAPELPSPETPVANEGEKAGEEASPAAVPTGDAISTPEPSAADQPAETKSPPARRHFPYLLFAAAVAGVVILGAAVWFALGLFSTHDIAVVFLDRTGKEIGRRGAPGDKPGQDSINYYLDWAYEEAERLTREKSGKVFVARTTFEADLQNAAEKLIAETLLQEGVRYRVTQAALVAMTPDGAVRAMVGGRSYKDSGVNRAAHSRRSPGSSFTPYVYLLALQGGADPNQPVLDATQPCENWTPEDYSGGRRRPVSLSRALARSLNATPVQLSLDERYGGREKLLELLRKLGLDGVELSCSMALGDQGVIPLNHVGAYAHFANGGKSVRPFAIWELRDKKDEVIYTRGRDEPEPHQIVDRAAVEKLNRMLQQVVISGTGKTAALDFTPVAGKTGTSAEYKDAWFIGFTGLLVTGVWMGNDDFSAADKLTGGTLPAQIWKSFNIAAHKDRKIPPIPGVDAQPVPSSEEPEPGH